jgi:hypothetical protein
MEMMCYIREIQHQLVDSYGFKAGDNGLPRDVPDGAYPMMIDGKLDLVLIVGGKINCCNFVGDGVGLAKYQEIATKIFAMPKEVRQKLRLVVESRVIQSWEELREARKTGSGGLSSAVLADEIVDLALSVLRGEEPEIKKPWEHFAVVPPAEETS